MSATAEKSNNAETLPALIPEITQDQWPAIYEGGDFLTDFIQRVRDEVTSEVPDLKTKKGRSRVASLAARVSSAKVAVEKPGRDYLKAVKAKVKPIEENIREFVRAMDSLRDQVRQPLTEWEEAEKARVKGHQDRIDIIKSLSRDLDGITSETLKQLIDESEKFDPSTFEELEGEAAAALLLTQKTLRDALQRRLDFEAEQARLEQQRQEQEAERQRLERARIEQEAANKARREAEANAQAEREAAQRREVEARMAQERAEREAEEAKQRAISAEQKAKEDAERAAQEAEARLKREAEQKAAAEAAEKERREADLEHRGNINRAAKEALIECGLSDEQAKAVMVAIIQGKVPNVSIQY
jgi:hypothetical protein